ncbi:MAG: SpoIIE family protein phosphatase [Myxococcota bacterium]
MVASEVAARPRVGELVSGDVAHHATEGDRHLLAVVDALGHGAVAHGVAQLAVAFLRGARASQGVEQIVEGLHLALRQTRGAAAAVCVLEGNTLSGCSVGNVALRAERSRLGLVATPGVLGVRLHRPRVFQSRLDAPDRLCIFSDGVSSRLDLKQVSSQPLRGAARRILEQFGHPHDDATVLLMDIGADA